MKLVIACFVGAGAALGFSILRLIEDGPAGEIVTGVAMVVAAILFVGGCVGRWLERVRMFGPGK